MKLTIFGVLACSLILTNAAYVDPNEVCAIQLNADVENAIQHLEIALESCAQIAFASNEADVDALKVTIGGSISLALGIRRCKRISKIILRSACIAAQIAKAKNSFPYEDTLSQNFVEYNRCSGAAEKSALAELELINRKIVRCVAM